MPCMTKSPATTVAIPAEIRAAFAQWKADHPGVTLSELMIRGLCDQIGRPDLVATIRQRGRPAKADPAPAKKTARKR